MSLAKGPVLDIPHKIDYRKQLSQKFSKVQLRAEIVAAAEYLNKVKDLKDDHRIIGKEPGKIG